MKNPTLILALTAAFLAANLTRAQDTQDTSPTNAPPAAPGDTNAPPPEPPPAPGDEKAVAQPPADNSASATVITPATNAPVVLANGELGLLMNFRNAPLSAVLEYMSSAAGYIIHPRVDVSGRVTVWSNQPVSKDTAVKMLSQMLSENGYAAIVDDKTLTIVRADEVQKNDGIPVIKESDPTKIPKNSTIATYIIPIHTLNVVQLVKILQTLLPSNTTVSADESANALVLTDTQANIHRVAEIVQALDTITSGNAAIQVFPLKFADSKATAQLIKDLFTADSTAGNGGNGGAGGRFGRFLRGGGGGGFPFGGGGGGGGGGDESNGHTPTAKVSAVSDDHSNSLVVSAPDALMPTIAELVKQVDVPVEDASVAKVFHLKNADPGEMADLLNNLFSEDPNSQSDASRPQIGGFRGFGGFGFGGGGNNRGGGGSTESDRMKKMARVSAVPDRRTGSLIVTAGTNVMDQIESIVNDLDESNAHRVSPHVIALDYADPIDIQTILQQQFTSVSGTPTASSGNTTLSNPLLYRMQQNLQQQNSASSSGAFGGVTSSRGISN